MRGRAEAHPARAHPRPAHRSAKGARRTGSRARDHHGGRAERARRSTRPTSTSNPAAPLMVIYTSGTTGLPKGINNNHFKLLGIGMVVSSNLELGPDDVGYACMPLFHSNAMFLGFQPAFHVGGGLAIRERFSAQQLRPRRPPARRDVLELRRRAGALRAGRAREAVRRRRGAHPRRGRAQSAEQAPLGDRQRRRRRPTSSASSAGSASRTCSSCTARPRRRSAPSARRATRAAASARSPTTPSRS